jgi:GAF domain-containing protein
LQQRLLAVVAASGALLRSPQVDDVAPALLRIARELVAADGDAVWRIGKDRVWQIRAFVGVSERFARQVVLALNRTGPTTMPFSGLLAVEDVFTSAMLRERFAAFAEEGIRSLLSIPLGIGDTASASLVLYYRSPHRFTEVEIETSRALGSIAAAALASTAAFSRSSRRRSARRSRAPVRSRRPRPARTRSPNWIAPRRLFQQRQPRVPHAADAAARTDRGRARRT